MDINKIDKSIWTHFYDMHSGGGLKQKPYQHIFIQAEEKAAKIVFYSRFGHDPDRVTCNCCGEDYSITQCSSLSEATAYNRNCAYSTDLKCWIEEPDTRYNSSAKLISLEDFLNRPDVLVITADTIDPDEYIGAVPKDYGY